MTEIVEEKKAVALVDLHLVGGLVIRKGQEVRVQLMYSKEWSYGGFRTVINRGLGFTNHEAFYTAFTKGESFC